MHRYMKGARGERELLNTLHEKGFSVMRSAGSGVNSLSPDMIAVKDGRALAFECKAWDRSSLSIDLEQFTNLLEWERNTHMETYVAWRMNNDGWYFMHLDEMTKNEKSYSVTKRRASEIARRLESLLI